VIWRWLKGFLSKDTISLSISFPIERTGYRKMSKWKYFTNDETKGMVDDICYKLDRARTLYGAPIVLTCGYRDPIHNAEIGGVADSAHTKGMAADLEAPTDHAERERFIWALCTAGFKRVESAPLHFHVDIDNCKPTPCFWVGKDF
jgi:hypothetical protein